MKYSFIYVILIAILSSCGQYKRFTYVQPAQNERDTLYAYKLIPYKLQPFDLLYVKISSSNKEASELFNTDISSSGSAMFGGAGGGSLYMISHMVDPDGNITLPVLNKVNVAGLTLEAAKEKIQTEALKYITDVQVEVKLFSFKVSVVGEVKSPGQYAIFNDRANILEVLAMAGDLTYNGNRRKVLILRSFRDGTKPIKVDLTSRKLLSNEDYFLQPNDIVYVEPFKTTVFRLRVADYSVLLTLLTSTITAILLINQFSK